MYIQFKHGFLEIDRWDGAEIPEKSHVRVIKSLQKAEPTENIMVVRARTAKPLEWIQAQLVGSPTACPVMATPTWDYEFRVYVTARQLAVVMTLIVDECSYRNFKSWTKSNADKTQARLAADIWQVAFQAKS